MGLTSVRVRPRARLANDFYTSRSRYFVKTDAKGVVRVYDRPTNTFGAFNPDGSTRTFFKPDPANHGRPSNWDYWLEQPGS